MQPTIVNWVKNSVGLGAAVTATALAAGAIAPVIGIPLVAAWLATQSWIEGRKERDSAQQLQRIETWLKKLVRKHGTLQDAVEAIRDGQEKHKGIDTGRAALIADVLAGRLTNIEAAIRENESLLVYGFEQLAQRIEGSADAIVAFEERFKTDFDSFKSTVVSRLDFIKDDTGSLVTGQEEINRKLDELLADKRAGEDPAQRTLTPEQEALVDAALAQGDAETKAKAAIAKRDFATAKKYLAEAMTPVLGKAFDLLTTQGDLHYFQGSFDEAIEPYDKALTLRPNNPAAMRNLALALQQAHLGSIADNVKRAISIHERILGAAEPHSPQWAMTQNNLGNALSELPTGDRGEHLARAIEAYEAALTVRTREQFPTDWAMTQNNLGNALQELPTGDRS
ncbi:MAG: tetratricopeptide repeat protein, partial [Phycisphaerales bacterium]|nr:tetratricopeptide repeat protein [Phycisphaerales bacterium]